MYLYMYVYTYIFYTQGVHLKIKNNNKIKISGRVGVTVKTSFLSKNCEKVVKISN